MSPDSSASTAAAPPAFRKRNLSSSSVGSNKRTHSDSAQPDSGDDEGSIGASGLQLNSPQSNSPLPSSTLAHDHNTMLTDSQPPAGLEVTPPTGAAPPGDVQRDVLSDFLGGALEAGESWYLISRNWYRKWQTACAGVASDKDVAVVTIEEVGPIDTFSLLDAAGQLRAPLVVDVDCSLVPSPAWHLLKQW